MSPVPVEYAGTLTWNVIFERGRTPWGHVLAAGFDGRSYVVVDPHVGWTEVFTLSPEQFDDWIVSAADRATVLRIAGGRRAPLLPGFFCVGTIKRLIGFASGALSPAGLRRDLLRAGAQQVFSREDEGQASPGRSRDQGGA